MTFLYTSTRSLTSNGETWTAWWFAWFVIKNLQHVLRCWRSRLVVLRLGVRRGMTFPQLCEEMAKILSNERFQYYSLYHVF
jgi:hypothetical protein